MKNTCREVEKKEPEISPHVCSLLILYQSANDVYYRKSALFHKWWCTTGCPPSEISWILIFYQLQKSPENKDLNVKPETVGGTTTKKNLPDENIAQTLQDTGINKEFLDKTPKAQQTKPKLDTRDYIKLKSLFLQSDHRSKDAT